MKTVHSKIIRAITVLTFIFLFCFANAIVTFADDSSTANEYADSAAASNVSNEGDNADIYASNTLASTDYITEYAESADNNVSIQGENENQITSAGGDNIPKNNSQDDGGSASTMATYNITVHGEISWMDDWGLIHPLQYSKVTLMDMGGGFLGLSDKLIGTTYTDTDGSYSFQFQSSKKCNPYLKIYPEGENTIVKTGSGGDYVHQTDPRLDITTSALISPIIPMSDTTGQAFQISQAVITASRFVKTMHGSYLDPVTVKYPHTEDYNEDGCFYRSSQKTIYITGGLTASSDEDSDSEPDIVEVDGIEFKPYASWDVIYHEFFHHVQHQFGIEDSPGGWHALNVNMYSHYISHYTSNPDESCVDEDGISCANPTVEQAAEYAIKISYAEAVATVLGIIAQDYMINEAGILYSNIKTVGDTSYTSYNGALFNCELATLNDEDDAIRGGEVCELSVIAVLWDIFDDAAEGIDTVSLGYSAFWNIITSHGSKTFSEFIATFYSTYPQYRDSISRSLQYYKFTASSLLVSNKKLSKLPTFNWTSNGSDSTDYQNNLFDIVFYDIYKTEILRKTVTSASYTLTEAEWNTVLSDCIGDYFFWKVEAKHDNGYGYVTGPYYSICSEVSLPSIPELPSTSPTDGEISEAGDYKWYKFVAPSSGSYQFYAESEFDTYADIFARPVYGLGIAGRLAHGDDSYNDRDFVITYELDYQQVIYIRVRGYSTEHGDYTIYPVLLTHIHSYNASCTPNDTSTHRCTCDCGAYQDVEHYWLGAGANRIRCTDCFLTVTGTIPGGSISSIGDDLVYDVNGIIWAPKESDSEE